MKNKMKFGLLLLSVAALVLVPMVSAYPSYVPSKASSCGVCHVSPGGGGKLTPAGATFKSTGKLPVATPPVVTPPVVSPPAVTPPVKTPPAVTPPVVTSPTPPTTPSKVVDDKKDHHDDNYHNGQKEHTEEQEQEHDED